MSADPCARNRRGAQPLHYAADGIPGERYDAEAQAGVVALLVGAGANPNAPDKSGVQPLHRAVRTRSSGAVRALLQQGAGVSAPSRSGSTPLGLAVQDTGRGESGTAAAREEQRAIIGLLLEHGARASEVNVAHIRAEWIRKLLAP